MARRQRDSRSSNWPRRWPPSGRGSPRAAEAAGRNSDEIELLPDHQILSGHRCIYSARDLGARHFGESREQEASNKAAEVAHIVWAAHADSLAHGRADPAQQSAVDRRLGVRRALGRQRAGDRRAGPRGGRRRWPTAGGPSRCGSTSSSASTATRSAAVWTSTSPDRVDELCAAAAGRRGPGVRRADGDPAAGMPIPTQPSRVCKPNIERVQRDYQQRLGLSAGMSSDLEMAVKHGSTCVRVGTALLGQRPLTSP